MSDVVMYSTGQIANICKVSQQTVIRWIDRDLLKGFRLPGSKHRRISHSSLVEFMKAQGLEDLIPSPEGGEDA